MVRVSVGDVLVLVLVTVHAGGRFRVRAWGRLRAPGERRERRIQQCAREEHANDPSEHAGETFVGDSGHHVVGEGRREQALRSVGLEALP